MNVSRILGSTLIALLAFATMAGAQTLPAGGTFHDDDGNVHEADIEAIAAEDITRGCNPPANDRFCPDAAVTRGEMAAFLVRAMGYTDDGGGDRFVDDDASVFEGDIDRLAVAGVTRGCNPPANDRFCPDESVSRAQMASFLTRALGLTPIQPPPPPPGDACPSIGAIVIDDDVVVAAGTTCTLDGTTVDGNVIVRSGATLVAMGVDVDGNVQADGHASVTVDTDSIIGGNIQLENGSTALIDTSDIDGDIQMESNDGSITITDNVVGGNIQVQSNTGGVVISANRVDGNLECAGNDPAPTGGANTVDGDKEGQCSGL